MLNMATVRGSNFTTVKQPIKKSLLDTVNAERFTVSPRSHLQHVVDVTKIKSPPSNRPFQVGSKMMANRAFRCRPERLLA